MIIHLLKDYCNETINDMNGLIYLRKHSQTLFNKAIETISYKTRDKDLINLDIETEFNMFNDFLNILNESKVVNVEYDDNERNPVFNSDKYFHRGRFENNLFYDKNEVNLKFEKGCIYLNNIDKSVKESNSPYRIAKNRCIVYNKVNDEYLELFVSEVNTNNEYSLVPMYTIVRLNDKSIDLYDDIILDKLERYPLLQQPLTFSKEIKNIMSFASDLSKRTKEEVEDIMYILMKITIILNNVLKLMGCKNIKLTEKTFTPRKEWWKKKHKQKNHSPYKYYELELIPITKKQIELNKKGEWNTKIRLCEGHFKTFSVDKPLFGKHSGEFWWQTHERKYKSRKQD